MACRGIETELLCDKKQIYEKFNGFPSPQSESSGSISWWINFLKNNKINISYK